MDPSTTLHEQQTHLSAAHILASTELLIWHANTRNESIPQTRLHFEKLLAGFNPNIPPPDWPDARPGSVDLERLAARRKARPARSVADRARAEMVRAAKGKVVVDKKEGEEEQEEKQLQNARATDAVVGAGPSGGAGNRGGSEGKVKDKGKGKGKATQEGTTSRRKRVRPAE